MCYHPPTIQYCKPRRFRNKSMGQPPSSEESLLGWQYQTTKLLPMLVIASTSSAKIWPYCSLTANSSIPKQLRTILRSESDPMELSSMTRVVRSVRWAQISPTPPSSTLSIASFFKCLAFWAMMTAAFFVVEFQERVSYWRQGYVLIIFQTLPSVISQFIKDRLVIFGKISQNLPMCRSLRLHDSNLKSRIGYKSYVWPSSLKNCLHQFDDRLRPQKIKVLRYGEKLDSYLVVGRQFRKRAAQVAVFSSQLQVQSSICQLLNLAVQAYIICLFGVKSKGWDLNIWEKMKTRQFLKH